MRALSYFFGWMWAIGYGRADKWWTWALFMIVLVAVLTYYFGIDALKVPDAYVSILIFGAISAAGVAFRKHRAKRKHD